MMQIDILIDIFALARLPWIQDLRKPMLWSISEIPYGGFSKFALSHIAPRGRLSLATPAKAAAPLRILLAANPVRSLAQAAPHGARLSRVPTATSQPDRTRHCAEDFRLVYA